MVTPVMLTTVLSGTVLSGTVLSGIGGFPVDDWQFWVGTVVCLGSLAVLLRPMLRVRGKGKGAASGCGGCAAAPRRSDLE